MMISEVSDGKAEFQQGVQVRVSDWRTHLLGRFAGWEHSVHPTWARSRCPRRVSSADSPRTAMCRHRTLTLIAQLPIERLEQHTPPICPLVEDPRGELGAVVHGDRSGLAVGGDRSVERFGHSAPGYALSRLQDRTPATQLIDDGEHPKGPTIEQRIVYEIHVPALVSTACSRGNSPMQARMCAQRRARAPCGVPSP
jgi:hypothetical protein